jgi:SOS-response transcriptional repressor LexA
MNKYEQAKKQLEETKECKFKAFGNSMRPIILSGATLTFKKVDTSEYTVGDVVFCKVRGRFIDAHKIIAIDKKKGFLIANNHGYENGWTHTIYGKVVKIEY